MSVKNEFKSTLVHCETNSRVKQSDILGVWGFQVYLFKSCYSMLGLGQMLDPDEGIVFISIPPSRPSSPNHNSDGN